MFVLRTTLYSMTLVCCVIQTAAGILAGKNRVVVGSNAGTIAMAAIVLSVISWIWIAIILSFNNRPASNHILTVSNVHLWSFVGLSTVWLAIGILTLTQTNEQCGGSYSISRCVYSAASGGAAILSVVFASASAITILLDAKKRTEGLNGNVAQNDLDEATGGARLLLLLSPRKGDASPSESDVKPKEQHSVV